LSWSTVGGVDSTIETGSDAGKVFLSASSSASSWCLRARWERDHIRLYCVSDWHSSSHLLLS
jgi:hypothetical protein